MDNRDCKVNVIGAGLTGPLLASFLNKAGYKVKLFERTKDFRKTKVYSGRSINLALSERGINALKEVALFSKINSHLIPMRGRMIHDLNGYTTLQRYGQSDKECIYSVSRSYLNEILISQAESRENIDVFFDINDFNNKKIEKISKKLNSVSLNI